MGGIGFTDAEYIIHPITPILPKHCSTTSTEQAS